MILQLFLDLFQQNFRSLSKIVLSVYIKWSEKENLYLYICERKT